MQIKPLMPFLIFFSTNIYMQHQPTWIHEDQPINISEFTNHMHTRYYFIARLTKTIQALLTCYNNKKLLTLHFDHHVHFTHKRITSCVNEIERTQDIKPLFICWKHIITYKSIEDITLLDEFAKVILIVLQKITPIVPEETSNRITDIHSYNLLSQSPSNILDCIDIYTDYMYENKTPSSYSQNISKKLSHYIQQKTNNLELNHIGSQEVALRFYLINRVRKPISLLSKYKHSQLNIFVLSPIVDNQTYFTHHEIKRCIEHMVQSNSITPLIRLYDILKQFRCISDTHLTKEFLQILFIILKLLDYSKSNTQLLQSSEYYEKLSDLSMQDLLQAIDIASEKIVSPTKVTKPICIKPITLMMLCSAPVLFISYMLTNSKYYKGVS